MKDLQEYLGAGILKMGVKDLQEYCGTVIGCQCRSDQPLGARPRLAGGVGANGESVFRREPDASACRLIWVSGTYQPMGASPRFAAG